MNVDTFTVLSLVINVLLIIISVALTVIAWKDKKNNKSQVKIWMEQANGIQNALQRVISDKWQGNYSTINDITSAIWSVHASAFSLYQSLYDERVTTEKEYKERQAQIKDKIEKELKLKHTKKKKKSEKKYK